MHLKFSTDERKEREMKQTLMMASSSVGMGLGMAAVLTAVCSGNASLAFGAIGLLILSAITIERA